MNNIREALKRVIADPFLRYPTIASFVFLLFTLILPIWKILPLSRIQPFIPLHYNIYFGVDRFGPWQYVFVLPAIGFVILLINTAVEGVFAREEKLLARFFSFITVFLQLFLFVAVTLIILLNV